MDADATSTERGSEMHKLGEQWIEEIDGKAHMVKAVKQTNKCSGCVFCTSIWCADHNQSERDFDCMTMIIKDLGILNEYGCLPEEHTGEYPTIKKVVSHELLMWVWWVGIDRKADVNGANLSIGVEALTKQQAIDAWNRRV